MSTPRAEVTVRISIEIASDPIRGRILDADGRSSAFAGWMELAGLIEQARDRPDNDSNPQPGEAEPARRQP